MKINFLLFALFVGLWCTVGCKSRTETPAIVTEQRVDTVKSDSVATDSTSTAAETPIPKKADEYFDDFAFAFMKKPRFQRSRIVFPLEHIVDGKRSEIQKSAWKYDRMYSARETYTLIFDSPKGAGMAKDTSVTRVVVEELDLSRQRIKSYLFLRENSEWRLTRLSEEKMERSANSDFYAFYQRFSTDPAYQREHISSQLAFSTFDEDNFKRMEGFISASQWPDFAPELPKNKLTNVLYGQTFNNSNLRLLSISSLSSGLTSTLTFRRRNGKWKLTRLDN